MFVYILGYSAAKSFKKYFLVTRESICYVTKKSQDIVLYLSRITSTHTHTQHTFETGSKCTKALTAVISEWWDYRSFLFLLTFCLYSKFYTNIYYLNQ